MITMGAGLPQKNLRENTGVFVLPTPNKVAMGSLQCVSIAAVLRERQAGTNVLWLANMPPPPLLHKTWECVGLHYVH